MGDRCPFLLHSRSDNHEISGFFCRQFDFPFLRPLTWRTGTPTHGEGRRCLVGVMPASRKGWCA
jgi:hypothetical protein